jgi:hypothetical protein
VISPLAAYFGGFLGLFLYSALKIAVYKTAVLSSLLINTLPGICANAYWVMPFGMSVIVPVLSFILFVVHPVGSSAFVYTLLWTIPVFIYFTKSNSFFFKALSATFIAHAVGSVLWLYLMPPMLPLRWIMLTPVALCERVIFAIGMSIVRSSVYAVATYLNRGVAYAKRWAM